MNEKMTTKDRRLGVGEGGEGRGVALLVTIQTHAVAYQETLQMLVTACAP